MKKRIGYIDSLKGFAMLLMVMGHVIARQFPMMNIISKSSILSQVLLGRKSNL